MSVAPRSVWEPHPGMQTQLCSAAEFEVLAGGAAGPGKTDALIYGGLYDRDNAWGRTLMLRASFPELREIMDRAQLTFPRLGGTWKESEKRWFWPSGFTYEFGYCSSYREALQYRGQQYSHIAYDDIGDLPDAERIWKFLSSRARAAGPGLRPMMRCSANPGGAAHAFLKRYFIVPCGKDGSTIHDPGTYVCLKCGEVGRKDPCDQCGGQVLKQLRRFIPGRLSDNPSILKVDPGYRLRLELLPELMRKQLLEGDWDAGSGAALEELSFEKHVVRPFEVPQHWEHFGAFDWGFTHWWVFGHYVVNEDGRVFKVRTLRGRRMLPRQIAQAIKEGCPEWDRLNPIVAGHDVKSDDRSRQDNTPTIRDSFLDEGIILSDANMARRAGLQRLREWVAWRGIFRDPQSGLLVDGQPMLLWFDNPGNRRALEALMEIVTDPEDPNMALKVDADKDTGEGGDDDYDETRMAMAERIVPARTIEPETFDMNSPAQLRFEAEQQRRHYTRSHLRRTGEKPVDPVLGTAY